MPLLASLTQQSLLNIGLAQGAVNLLENSDFRTGDFTGWTLVDQVSANVVNEQAVIEAAATATFSQTVTVAPNTAHKLEFTTVAVDVDGAGFAVDAFITDTSGNRLILDGSSPGTVSGLFYTTESQVTLSFSITDAVATLDDIFVGEASEEFYYPLQANTDPTSADWQATHAPAGYLFVPSVGIYSQTAVTSAERMFFNNATFNDPNLADWDTGTIVNMGEMFSNAAAFDQDISSWDTSNTQNMSSMFNSATSFNQSIASWNVREVANMDNMFNNADAFDQDISSWATNSLLSADDFSTGAAQKGANWTTAEHPSMRLRSTFGTIVGVSSSAEVQIVCDDAVANAPATPFTLTGTSSGKTVTVTSTTSNDAGQTVLIFSSTSNDWFIGESLEVTLYET